MPGWMEAGKGRSVPSESNRNITCVSWTVLAFFAKLARELEANESSRFPKQALQQARVPFIIACKSTRYSVLPLVFTT